MPIGSRTRRVTLLTAKVLALVLLAVSPRGLVGPTTVVNKSEESRRPKSPKNIVRAEPLRLSGVERQGQSPGLPGTTLQDLAGSLVRPSLIHALPRKAFTQLTKPDYLKSYSAGIPPIPLGPPA